MSLTRNRARPRSELLVDHRVSPTSSIRLTRMMSSRSTACACIRVSCACYRVAGAGVHQHRRPDLLPPPLGALDPDRHDHGRCPAPHTRVGGRSLPRSGHPKRNRPNRRPEPSRCWHRSPATCKRWTSATSLIWLARRHTPCNSLCSSAITSPPAAVWAGAGAGVRLTTPPIPMCRNVFCGTCTSDSSGHSSRTSGSDYRRWWT